MAGVTIGQITIASGSDTSSEIACGNNTIAKIFLPSTFDGSSITFEGATEAGGTFTQIVDSAGAAISKTCTASDVVALAPADLWGVPFVKIVASGNQTTTDTIIQFSYVSL